MTKHEHTSEQVEPLEDLCLAVQRLVQQGRITEAPPDVLEEARRRVEDAIALLQPHAFDGPYAQHQLDGGQKVSLGRRASDDPADIMPYSPFIGHRNPVSPRFRLKVEEAGRLASGDAVFPPAFAGPPGCVHGGLIAGLFDELLSVPNWSGGPGGFTGTLSVRYHKLTPLQTPLALKAECVRQEKRKVIVQGDMRCNGEVTASAEAIFVQPRNRGLI